MYLKTLFYGTRLYICRMEIKKNILLLDLGGVIINIDYLKTIEAFETLGLHNAAQFYSQQQQTQLFDQFECGKISTQRFINELLHFLPPRTSPNKVVEAWNAMILDFPIERLNQLKTLKEKHPIYLLSNTNEIHMQAVRRSLKNVTNEPLESFFNQVFLSHEIGLRKPNANVFDFVCEKINCSKEQVFFIDDSIQHVEGAKQVGIQSHCLQKGEEFYEILS